jgi:hypothetical protein
MVSSTAWFGGIYIFLMILRCFNLWNLFSAMHGSLVTSSLIRETTENESANEGYRFGQEEETYNIVALSRRRI